MKKRKNLFSIITMQGARVRVLHQIGKCAVARVIPADPARPTYLITRFRQFYAEAATLAHLPAALHELRRQDNAEVRRDKEQIAFAQFLEALPEYSAAALETFYAAHNLDPGQAYSRRDLRRSITSQKLPKAHQYLSWLNRVSPSTVTNPTR